MKTISCLLAAAIIAAVPVSRATAQEVNAKELAGKITSNINRGSSFIRLRMTAGGTTFQLQLKERRTRDGSDMLYQVLYPKSRKGEAVLLQKHGGKTSGKVFTAAGGVKDIGSMKEGMFGSDLSYEDIIENFFAWDQQAVVGTEAVGKTNCQILESKPSGSSSYSRVRSWVDTRKSVPLRVEKYSGSTLVRRIETTRVAEDDADHPVVASLVIKRPAQNSETEIEGSNIKQDITYTDADFSAQGMQNLAPPPSK